MQLVSTAILLVAVSLASVDSTACPTHPESRIWPRARIQNPHGNDLIAKSHHESANDVLLHYTKWASQGGLPQQATLTDSIIAEAIPRRLSDSGGKPKLVPRAGPSSPGYAQARTQGHGSPNPTTQIESALRGDTRQSSPNQQRRRSPSSVRNASTGPMYRASDQRRIESAARQSGSQSSSQDMVQRVNARLVSQARSLPPHSSYIDYSGQGIIWHNPHHGIDYRDGHQPSPERLHQVNSRHTSPSQIPHTAHEGFTSPLSTFSPTSAVPSSPHTEAMQSTSQKVHEITRKNSLADSIVAKSQMATPTASRSSSIENSEVKALQRAYELELATQKHFPDTEKDGFIPAGSVGEDDTRAKSKRRGKSKAMRRRHSS